MPNFCCIPRGICSCKNIPNFLCHCTIEHFGYPFPLSSSRSTKTKKVDPFEATQHSKGSELISFCLRNLWIRTHLEFQYHPSCDLLSYEPELQIEYKIFMLDN